MIITINGKTRNYIFLAVLVTTILGLIAAFSITAEENKVNKENYIHYQQAMNLIKQKEYVQAQTMLKQLDKSYLQTYQVQQNLGLCYAEIGNYGEAAKYMKQAQTTCPVLVTDQTFLEKYGEIFYHLGQYEKARLYLTESTKYNENPQVNKNAQNILQQIKDK